MEINYVSKDYEIRKARFQNFAKDANLILVSDMVAKYKIESSQYLALSEALLTYFRKATGQNNIDENNFGTIEEFNCKNITPNGAVVPKTEYEYEYNCALKIYYEIIMQVFQNRSLFEKLHFPVNFRLKQKKPDPRNFGRGLDTAIPHSDAWVGEDSGGFNFFLPVLGDVSRNRLRFFDVIDTKKFREEWLSPVNSYLDHKNIIKMYTPNELIIPEKGYLYISDFAIIHETHLDSGAGNRMSCDTGIYISKNLNNIIKHEDRDDEYINFIPKILSEHFVKCLQSTDEQIVTKPTQFSHYTKKIIKLVSNADTQ